MAGSERDLVDEASRGDAQSLAALLERHLPGVLAYVHLHAGAHLLAHESTLDLVQSACREVLQDLRGHRYNDEEHFRRWLYLAAERKILDRARSLRRAKRAAGTVPLTDAEAELAGAGCQKLFSPSQAAMGRETLVRLQAALSELDPRSRHAVLLARVVGLSNSEVAALLGCTEGAARVCLHRGLARLARLLRE